ncbi:MAG: toxin-antitoxin system YwqK family antitoxin [Saprospiraceae bacterium]|nr:toxin-antitoxin system YwqK family antitoxin [Saprospiraceae bacterium]
MRLFSIFLLIIVLSSCEKKKTETKYDSGNIKESYSVNNEGNKEGEYVFYYESGKIKEKAIYVNGMLTGARLLYHENGQIEIEEMYNEKGVLEGPYKVYYASGKVQLEKQYVQNEINGTIKVYYPSGTLKEEVTMEHNEENGPFTEYYNNGKIHWKGTYRNGDNEYGVLYEYDSLGAPIKIMKCDTMAICRSIWKHGMPEINTDTIKI